MKLNHDCIRATLLAIESMDYIIEDNDNEICFEAISFNEIVKCMNKRKEKYSRIEIFYTLHNLEQGGYISASCGYSNDSVEDFFVNYITYSGHQFLDTVRDSASILRYSKRFRRLEFNKKHCFKSCICFIERSRKRSSASYHKFA